MLLVHLLLPFEDQTRLEFELRGKAWKIYWLLLKHTRPMSVREVQRTVHFSSPSGARITLNGYAI
jgi:predicted DNA-binding transcriptional regulator